MTILKVYQFSSLERINSRYPPSILVPALIRINKGTFGVCNNCSESIGYDRLIPRRNAVYVARKFTRIPTPEIFIQNFEDLSWVIRVTVCLILICESKGPIMAEGRH